MQELTLDDGCLCSSGEQQQCTAANRLALQVSCGERATVAVTGASSGLGLATAVQLAKDGNFVIMGCRDVAKGT